MAQNAYARKRVDEIQSTVTAEKEWWEKKKASIQEGFMKELDEDSLKSPTRPVNGRNSDEDAVLVERDGPVGTQGGGKKKKKGKN